MKITKVGFEQIFPVLFLGELNTYVNKRMWAEVALEDGEDSNEAWAMAEKNVHKYFSDNNKETIAVMKYITDGQQPIIRRTDFGDADIEFDRLKEKLAAIDNKEDAEAFLQTTDFKNTIEAKSLVNKKPNKINTK